MIGRLHMPEKALAIVLAALVSASLLLACSSGSPDTPQSATQAETDTSAEAQEAAQADETSESPDTPDTPEIPPDAYNAYQAAKAAVRSGNMNEARNQLSLAASIKPDFTEAWYNLGAATMGLSIEEMRAGRESESVALMREAVAAKKRAQQLIDEGKWFIYKTPAEQEQVKSDLANALKDADEVMADEASLIAAIKLWAMVQ